MEFVPCKYVKYIGHRQNFIQSIDRQKYGFTRENGFVCNVSNPDHMILLIKRVAQLVPVMPAVETKKSEVPPSPPAPKPEEIKKETKPIKKEKRYGRRD